MMGEVDIGVDGGDAVVKVWVPFHEPLQVPWAGSDDGRRDSRSWHVSHPMVQRGDDNSPAEQSGSNDDVVDDDEGQEHAAAAAAVPLYALAEEDRIDSSRWLVMEADILADSRCWDVAVVVVAAVVVGFGVEDGTWHGDAVVAAVAEVSIHPLVAVVEAPWLL